MEKTQNLTLNHSKENKNNNTTEKNPKEFKKNI